MGNPKSFKIPLNSPLANTLKSSISQKLHEFLGNYSDDVLAEYITVLVCNGKHQNQARDDLEAFLGDRSEEFVSWLWDLLLDYTDQSKTSTVPLDPKAVSLISPHEHDDDMDCRAERSRDLDNHGTSNSDRSLTAGEKLHHPSTHASYTLSADTRLSEHFQRSSDLAAPTDVKTVKVSLLVSGNDTRSKPEPVEDTCDEFLAHGCSGKDSFTVMPTSGEERIEKIVDSKAIDMPKELFSPLKQPYPGRLRSSIAEYSLPGRTSDAHAKFVTAVTHKYGKPRVSVWDRLGSPLEKRYERSTTVDAPHISNRGQNGVGLHQSVQALPLPSEGHSKEKAPGPGNSANNSAKYKRVESGVNINGKLNDATTIRRKRGFGESSTGSGNSSVPLVGKGNLQYKETSGDPKRSKLVEEVSEATTLSQKISDFKVRFHELEKEICKLRSKHTGPSKHPGEDIEPRTIYVTNVHFAATKEALSNHFAKCGLVVNVVLLTDETTAQPKRSALITFASVESVNKALALSGTSFFSRTVKVFRKADMAAGKSAPPQVAGMPVQARFTQIKRKTAIDRPLYPSPHLQWRRESASNPSKPSSSANIQEKESVSDRSKPSASANIQEKESVSNPSESSTSANIQEKSATASGSQQVFQS